MEINHYPVNWANQGRREERSLRQRTPGAAAANNGNLVGERTAIINNPARSGCSLDN
jgi:hypothetical protein